MQPIICNEKPAIKKGPGYFVHSLWYGIVVTSYLKLIFCSFFYLSYIWVENFTKNFFSNILKIFVTSSWFYTAISWNRELILGFNNSHYKP